MATQESDNLWDFALKTYGSSGASDACLLLQEESRIDVPVLLFALWLAANSAELSEAELHRIDVRIRDWREEVVWPLRTIRRRLKTGPSPAPNSETNTLRNSVKAAELNAEKIELALLEEEGRALMGRAQPIEGVSGRNAAIVVRYYRGSDIDSTSQAALDTILRAL